MAESFSRPDPASPAAVASATFGTARKGFDQQQVREFLRQVAGELTRFHERDAALQQEVREARAAQAAATPAALDEDTVTRLLGEEAVRILQTARESGSQIKAKAEEGAARLLREASEESARVRQETDVEIARRRHDAAADVEAELAMAKQQGREMVEEARTYRERVLGELARRREVARQQIDQLMRSRDRLVQAFERARLTAADVIAEVAPLEAPDDDIDLSPTTGPVPVVKVDTPDDSAVAATPLPGEDGGGAMYDREHERADTGAADTGAAVPAVEGPAGERDTAELPVVDGPDDDSGPDATIVPFPGASTASTAAPAAVDDLFARLRAESTDDEPAADAGAPATEVAADAAPVPEPDGDAETPFTVREAALVPLIVAGARKYKRALADEQNEVLDALRRNEKSADLDALVSDEGTQSTRYAESIASELAKAATAGAQAVTADADTAADASAASAAAGDALARELVTPLRERLARCVAEGDGDVEAIVKRVRAVYREWKTQRIDEQLDHIFRTAYARAAYEAIAPGGHVQWLVDPDGPQSPDCEDNSLAGTVVVGDTFPTGHAYPPAHPGCRCLLVPAAAS